MVGRVEVKLHPESVMLSVTWVITVKGWVECSKPKARLVARDFVSDAIVRETAFSGASGQPIARSLISRVATLRSSGKKLKMMLLDVTTAFLCSFSERPLTNRFPRRTRFAHSSSGSSRLARSLHGTGDAP